MDTHIPELPYDRPPAPGAAAPRGLITRALADGGAAPRLVASTLGLPLQDVTLAAWAVVLAGYGHRAPMDVGVIDGGAAFSCRLDADLTRTYAELARSVAPSLAADAGRTASSPPAAFALLRDDARPSAARAGTDLVVGLASPDAAGLAAEYRTDRFDDATVERVLDHLASALTDLAERGPGLAVGEVEIMPPAERAQLAAWNDTAVAYPEGETLASLFRAGVTAHAERPALSFGERTLTYAELGAAAERVASEVVGRGIGRGDLVGVLAERSVELVAGLHGILLAGAGYVALDPEYPAERLGYMVAETGMRLVLGQDRLQHLLGEAAVDWVDLAALPGAPAGADGPVPIAPEPGDVASVLYTSGSTGRPKGVANAHAGLVNRLRWMQERYRLGPGDVVLQKTPFSFDVSEWELFWPFQVGATLVVADPGGHRDPAYLVKTIAAAGVDTIHFVPSMLRLFLDHPAAATCTSLRRVICSGEALTRDLVERTFAVLPGVELHNLYGPTEAAIDVTAWECRPADPSPVVPIGAPIANTTIHVLDARMRPVPIGIPGELYIGGVQVALGYVNRPDLTAERFVPDPFRPGGRLYRTGDLARWLPSGVVDFLGRLDHQVKLRGQRIELGEIEATLGEHPAVLEAVVTVAQVADDATLIAHVMWRGEPASDADLRAFLAERLPVYMLPNRFMGHDALPLTSSGKVDRNRLAELQAEQQDRPPARTAGAGAATAAGTNDLESFLLGIWRRVLGRDDVGRHDRAFDLGATSLQAAAFVNEVQRELGEFIYVVTVFTAPTVAEYAAFLVREYPIAVAGHFPGVVPAGAARGAGRVDEAAVRRMAEIVPGFGPYPSWGQGKPNPPMVFILAPPRSGTTLLRVMLAGHPGLFAASELQLLGFDTLPQRRAALEGRHAAWREGTIRALMELEGTDAETATVRMEEHERSGLSAKAFYRWLQDRAGGKMLVDKSPTYALDLEVLRNAERGFAAPRYIHLVRDPVAMSRSFESYHMDQILFLRDHEWGGRTLGELVWTLSHRNILRFAEEVAPQRMLLLRFEDLVRDPRAAMTEVASFLGLDYHESLIRPYEHLETKMVDGLHPESTPMGDTRLLERDRIDPSVATRWTLPDGDAGIGEPTLRLARRFGYGGPASGDAVDRRRRVDASRERRLARRSNG